MRRMQFEQLGRISEVAAGRHGVDLELRGVFMSTLGSILTSIGFGLLPHSDSGVVLKPAWILWTAA